jgi:hypothetical protein
MNYCAAEKCARNGSEDYAKGRPGTRIRAVRRPNGLTLGARPVSGSSSTRPAFPCVGVPSVWRYNMKPMVSALLFVATAMSFVASNDAMARQSSCPTGFHGSRARGVGTGPIWRGEQPIAALFGGTDITAVIILTQGSDCNLCAADRALPPSAAWLGG